MTAAAEDGTAAFGTVSPTSAGVSVRHRTRQCCHLCPIGGRVRRGPASSPARWDDDAMSFAVGRLDRITVDPTINHGKPSIRGMRIPVQTLFELLASGMTFDEVLADYPALERDDLSGCARIRRALSWESAGAAVRSVKFLVEPSFRCGSVRLAGAIPRWRVSGRSAGPTPPAGPAEITTDRPMGDEVSPCGSDPVAMIRREDDAWSSSWRAPTAAARRSLRWLRQ